MIKEYLIICLNRGGLYEGKTVLFVGTKKQAQDCMKEAAEKCGMYYVNQRWLGGMLTNFATIEKRIERLNQLEKMEEDGTFEVLPKKEVILLKKEMDKLEKNLGGIKNMKEMPGVLFIVDPKKERIAILEAKKLGIDFGGLTAVNNFDIKVEENDIYGLIGPNGAGKTTVFNLLTKVYQPTRGSIILNGVDTKNMSTVDVNKAGIARTFQNIRLFNKMTVMENVLVGFHNNITYSTLDGIFKTPKSAQPSQKHRQESQNG